MKFSRRNFLKAASQGIALTAVGIGSAKRVIAALPREELARQFLHGRLES